MVKKKACVFISGTGTNLKALIKSSREYNFPININYIVSNTKKAKGIKFAKLYKIPFQILNLNKTINLEFFLKELQKKNIEIICLAGYMKILNKYFIKRFKKKIINIHPSLLPKYKGLNTFKKALKNNDKLTGCTVHYVNNKLDSGKMILQKRIVIEQNDNVETLKTKVQNKEYRAYSESIVNIFR
ncbi:MAG: phosphoribosylglycinamide formyltransferase [Pelagibacteraceae bacterium]|jgi:phosphoribosylglycinamide formyltransferase 1|nr:phosphoribosylglycinamide formyltransferase [Pelagibacteraceae bacterium]